MQPDQKRRSPREAGLSKGAAFGDGLHRDDTPRYHVTHATAEPLLQRLDGVQKAGNGWRAKCPACGGASRKLSIAERDNRVLLHCFAGCSGDDVIAAVGLKWSDLHPPRHWPLSPGERKAASRALREAGWAAALSVLSIEGVVLHLAALELHHGRALTGPDRERLSLACFRIDRAALVLTDKPEWKPDEGYAPQRLATIKREAATDLQRQLDAAEKAAQAAEAALNGMEAA